MPKDFATGAPPHLERQPSLGHWKEQSVRVLLCLLGWLCDLEKSGQFFWHVHMVLHSNNKVKHKDESQQIFQLTWTDHNRPRLRHVKHTRIATKCEEMVCIHAEPNESEAQMFVWTKHLSKCNSIWSAPELEMTCIWSVSMQSWTKQAFPAPTQQNCTETKGVD